MKNAQHLAFINRTHSIIYDRNAICRELQATANGDAYYGNALYIARDLPELDESDRDELSEWLSGADRKIKGSHSLNDIILKIQEVSNKKEAV